MPCTILVGGQWGDEAKGKFCSYLALTDDCSVACRAGDGPGAGHTVVHEGKEYRLRQTPGGFINRRARLLAGAGTLISPEAVLREIAEYGLEGRLGIDFRASIIEPEHVAADREDPHLARVVQTTGSGHGPCFAARGMRTARLARDIESLKPHLADAAVEVNDALDRGELVLIEGTGGYLLSVLYGTYPNVVGKDLTAGTFAADMGVGPLRIDEVVVAFKVYPTRVGPGAFPTELDPAEVDRLGFVEHATVTRRRRRLGNFDFELAAAAIRVNHPSYLAISFIDRLDPECRGKSYEQLGRAARSFLDRVEDELHVPVGLIGTGPGSLDIIDRRGAIRTASERRAV